MLAKSNGTARTTAVLELEAAESTDKAEPHHGVQQQQILSKCGKHVTTAQSPSNVERESNALEIPAQRSAARTQVDSRCVSVGCCARSRLERNRLAQHLELYSIDLEMIASVVAGAPQHQM